jgi:hypothetical protein
LFEFGEEEIVSEFVLEEDGIGETVFISKEAKGRSIATEFFAKSQGMMDIEAVKKLQLKCIEVVACFDFNRDKLMNLSNDQIKGKTLKLIFEHSLLIL